MAVLTSSGTFEVVDASDAQADLTFAVLPVLPNPTGRGRIVHPTLGAYDYEVKPDEWMNIDGDVIVGPTWMAVKTLTGAASAVWAGDIRDVVVEERWKSLGGLAMPAGMLRALMLVWMNPPDPSQDYVTWFPNYISGLGFKVEVINLQVGSGGLTFDDVVNYKDVNGDDGWITNPVTFTLKIAGRV